MSAAYRIGQLVKLIEATAPKPLRVFENVQTAGTLGATLGVISMHWMEKCNKQLFGREARDAFGDAVGAILDGVAVEDLERHWNDEMRGQYTLGYMQSQAGGSVDELTVSEAAEVSGVERQAILARIKAGSLPGRKERGRWLVRRADLDAWTPGKTGPKAQD